MGTIATAVKAYDDDMVGTPDDLDIDFFIIWGECYCNDCFYLR